MQTLEWLEVSFELIRLLAKLIFSFRPLRRSIPEEIRHTFPQYRFTNLSYSLRQQATEGYEEDEGRNGSCSRSTCS